MTKLSLMKRNLDALTGETFDLLILGGGITGAGVALDAAMRGLRVALIDKGDFAAGTSSVSSKLVHGGLRYLEHGDFHLVLRGAARAPPAAATPRTWSGRCGSCCRSTRAPACRRGSGASA